MQGYSRSGNLNQDYIGGQEPARQFSPFRPAGSGLSEIIGAIRRRIWVLISTVVVVSMVGAFVLSQLTPRFTAEAMVLIESQESNIVSLESVVAGLPGDAASVQSEAYILNSRTLVHRVIDRLGLLTDPEFNSKLEDVAAERMLDSELDSESLHAAHAYQVVSEQFHSSLSVKPQINSRVIAVAFVSEQPEKARLITNTLLDEYILSRLEAKYESTRRANSWLSERIDELRVSVEKSESEVEKLRQQYGLLKDNGETLSSQELSEINAQLILSRSQRAELSARLRELKKLNSLPDGLIVASEILDTSLVHRLREQQVQIERTIAELSSEYGRKHPRMIKLAAEERDVKAKIAYEVNKAISGLENDINVALAKERSLAASIENLKADVAVSNQSSIKVRMVEREADANRALLATLLTRQKETMSQEDFDFQQPDARIISYADVPLEPSFPNVPAVLALLFIGSMCLGLFIILFLELLDHGVHSGEDLYQQTGVPFLGFSPNTPSIANDRTLTAFAAARNSAFGQSIKTLNWSIKLAFPNDDVPKTILITSSVPLEGKSTIATCLAYNQAVTGSKVLLIDADMRRPTIHDNAGIGRGTGLGGLLKGGLVGLLQGRVTLDEAMIQYEDSDLFIIPAGSANNFDSEGLVSSEKMDQLLEQAAQRFDLVIIDTPPVMACSDARIVSKKVDATVFVVKWGATKLAVVKAALEQLSSVGARFAGVYLSMVNLKRYATYEYGDSGAYSGEMSHYYSGSSEAPPTNGGRQVTEQISALAQILQTKC